MASSTIQLARCIASAQAYCGTRPLVGVGNNATFPNEPAFTIGDWVRQAMLSPPFAWRWNRGTAQVAIDSTTQDYSNALPSFGWIERATINITGSSAFNKELTIRPVLTQDNTPNQPAYISVQSDDGTGNITFRVLPNPDKQYTLNITYQKAAPVFTNITDPWAPIPDWLFYVYNQGFLAKAYEQKNDERFVFAMQLFFRQLIAAAEGLTEADRNLFLDHFLATQRQVNNIGGKPNPAAIGGPSR